MKFGILLVFMATVGVQCAEKSVLIRFTPVTVEQYKSLLEANENADESQRSEDSRFISWSRLTSLASNFDMGKYLSRLFGGNNRETKNLSNYPLCTLNAPTEGDARQLDYASYPYEEYIQSLNLPGDNNKGTPVINCVLVLEDNKKHKTTKRPTTTKSPPVYPHHPPPHSYGPWYPGYPSDHHANGRPSGYPPKYPDHNDNINDNDDGDDGDDHRHPYPSYYPPYGNHQYHPYPYPYMPYPHPPHMDNAQDGHTDNDDDDDGGDGDNSGEHLPLKQHLFNHLNLPNEALQYFHLNTDTVTTTRRPRLHSGARPTRRHRKQKHIVTSPYSDIYL